MFIHSFIRLFVHILIKQPIISQLPSSCIIPTRINSPYFAVFLQVLYLYLESKWISTPFTQRKMLSDRSDAAGRGVIETQTHLSADPCISDGYI